VDSTFSLDFEVLIQGERRYDELALLKLIINRGVWCCVTNQSIKNGTIRFSIVFTAARRACASDAER